MKNIPPKDWDVTAHTHWQKGEREAAIHALLSSINAYKKNKPLELIMQLAYYLFLCGDPASAAHLLTLAKKDYPNDLQLLENLAVCLAKSGQYEKAIEYWQEFLAMQPDTYNAYDSLCRCLYEMGRYKEAAVAGTYSLALKDQQHATLLKKWALPNLTPVEFMASSSKKNVISFSLWGNHPRYLRGALDNALAAPTLYPEWTLRFYMDESVPVDVRHALTDLGADIMMQPQAYNMIEYLTWRFKVANDPQVGRFLVRDVDAVIGYRERQAVNEWVSSSCWFHIMRDWWTHTDLILGGMWGGIAGVLPDLTSMIHVYHSSYMETFNIDQWFLRDNIWAYVRQSCYIHDRCFHSFGAKPWPGPTPEGNQHVGQDIFTTQQKAQEKRLKKYIAKIKSLS